MSKKKHIRVLSINGGGVKGIIPATILHNITLRTNRPISELFDYVIGTSIGGIIAVALTVPEAIDSKKPKYTTQNILNMLCNDAKKIFPDNLIPFIPRTQLVGAKYSRSGIDSFLAEKAGEYTLRDTIIPIAMISYSLDQNKPRLWSTYKAQRELKYNFKLSDAAGATSAAPTYFPCKITRDSNGNTMKDVDGGIFANSPTMIAISELKKIFPGLDNKDITVVSLGTGITTKSGDTTESWFDGVVPWAKTLHNIMMKATETTDQILASEILGSKRYAHIDCPIAKELEELDNADQKNLKLLQIAAENCLNTKVNDDLLNNIVQCLEKLEKGTACDIVADHVLLEFKIAGEGALSTSETDDEL